jgi:peptidoglycan/xylan/chitin deacetylase (PgdA/CDA1 family)
LTGPRLGPAPGAAAQAAPGRAPGAPAGPARGTLIISLDFELYWGVRDKRSLAGYRDNLLGVRTAIPRVLDLFREYGVHATWATVGLLCFETKEQLLRALPEVQPRYANPNLSPYPHIAHVGRGEKDDPFHYGHSLIEKILATPHQEIGTHTFSHYYCLERGQDVRAFAADLDAAVAAAKRFGVTLRSLVFPRHQFNDDYLEVCRDKGITAFRGHEKGWLYRARNEEQESAPRRVLRLVDAYVNLSGHNAYPLGGAARQDLYNLPSSRFLRPHARYVPLLEPLRLRRNLADMTYAAEGGLAYHLWWHPHNFGVNQDANLAFLRRTLDHFARLRDRAGMESLNMGEVACRLREAGGDG